MGSNKLSRKRNFELQTLPTARSSTQFDRQTPNFVVSFETEVRAREITYFNTLIQKYFQIL